MEFSSLNYRIFLFQLIFIFDFYYYYFYVKFSCRKILKKEKKQLKNDFTMLGFTMKNMKKTIKYN